MCTHDKASGITRYDRENRRLIGEVVCDNEDCRETLISETFTQDYQPDPVLDPQFEPASA